MRGSKGMKPLFVTAPARSGSTLLARILDSHSQVAIASDPALPLFSHFRNRVWEDSSFSLPGRDSARTPLLDYYFDEEYEKALSLIRASRWDVPIRMPPLIMERIQERLLHESGDLKSVVAGISATRFDDWVDQFLRGLLDKRNKTDSVWAGIKEVWTVEFVESLARTFPDAKFVCLMRDPRAIVSSLIKLAKKDPSQMAHVPSYLRHWRKFVAFHSEFQDSELLRGRWLLLRYEDLVSKPVKEAKRLCEFLHIDFEPAMIDSGSFQSYSHGVDPVSNSAYPERSKGISETTSSRWERELDTETKDLCAHLAGSDAAVLGYDTPSVEYRGEQLAAILEFYGNADCSWRSDSEDYRTEADLEISRKVHLMKKNVLSEADLSRLFLFESAYEAIHSL